MVLPRRDFLRTVAVGYLASGIVPANAKSVAGAAKSQDPYFLSSTNPVANRDQRDLEALAIALAGRPDMQAARKRTAAEFARVTSNRVTPEVWRMFDAFVADYCFRSILMAVNADAGFPRVLRVYSPAGTWLGHTTPASRWGLENPDNCYRIIPVEYGGRYVLRGRVPDRPPSHVSYILVSDTNTSVTEGILELKDMDVARDGTFVLTLDETPAAGRRNHIQLTRWAKYVFNRDTMGDWNQTPLALRVERVNPPARAPLTHDEIADLAARIMHDGVAPLYYWINTTLNEPEARMKPPELTGPSGGLLTQMSSGGWFRLTDDQAAVITASPLDASYFSIVLYDMWGRTLEYRDHQTSLNTATMRPDADGRFTFVLSHRDPGIHNWLDTTGQDEVIASFRWQGIAASNRQAPAIQSRVVPLPDLSAALPAGAARLAPSQRLDLLDRRKRGFDRRFVDR